MSWSDSLTRQTISLDADTLVVWGYGGGTAFDEHIAKGSKKINFQTGSVSSVLPPAQQIAHGVIMVTAMAILLPTGAFIARFGKEVPPTTGPNAWWFGRHKFIQYTGASFLLAAFALILWYQSKYADSHFRNTHGILGLVVVCTLICVSCLRPSLCWSNH